MTENSINIFNDITNKTYSNKNLTCEYCEKSV